MVSKAPATYQDVLDAPKHQVAELIDGELFLSPRPGGPHTVAASNLGMVLGPPFHHGRGGPGGWLIIDEPELHLAKDVRVVVPDLAGWRVDRMPLAPDDHKYTVVPDWVCEIASTSTMRVDRKEKLPLYANAGVTHFWWIMPRARTLEVMRNIDGHWAIIATYSDDDMVQAEPFGDINFDLASLWRGMATYAMEDRAFDQAYL